ncbi:MAG: hypothetical protein ABL911_10345 [Gallionella sp.]
MTTTIGWITILASMTMGIVTNAAAVSENNSSESSVFTPAKQTKPCCN